MRVCVRRSRAAGTAEAPPTLGLAADAGARLWTTETHMPHPRSDAIDSDGRDGVTSISMGWDRFGRGGGGFGIGGSRLECRTSNQRGKGMIQLPKY